MSCGYLWGRHKTGEHILRHTSLTFRNHFSEVVCFLEAVGTKPRSSGNG